MKDGSRCGIHQRILFLDKNHQYFAENIQIMTQSLVYREYAQCMQHPISVCNKENRNYNQIMKK